MQLYNGLRAREDLNGIFRSVGDFNEIKARWAVKTGCVCVCVGGGGVLDQECFHNRKNIL